MKPASDQRADPQRGEEAVEPGYAAWKCEKVERGLAQSRARDAMIPVEQLWRDMKLEG